MVLTLILLARFGPPRVRRFLLMVAALLAIRPPIPSTSSREP